VNGTLLLSLMCAGVLATGLPAYEAGQVPGGEPRNVTFCEMAKDPQSFADARVRLTATVLFAFEHFTLWDPDCATNDANFELWVTYGGVVTSGAVYCCPGEGRRADRATPLPAPVVQDNVLKAFRSMLLKERDAVARATLVGTVWLKSDQEGYGHFGLSSLFVIERVLAFEPHNRKDVDYSVDAAYHQARELPCGYNTSSDWHTGGRWYRDRLVERFVRLQVAADLGERAWSLTDPARVALEAIREVRGETVTSLRRIRSSPARQVYDWARDGRVTTVVVSRPYFLVRYAKSAQIAWVPIELETKWCK